MKKTCSKLSKTIVFNELQQTIGKILYINLFDNLISDNPVGRNLGNENYNSSKNRR